MQREKEERARQQREGSRFRQTLWRMSRLFRFTRRTPAWLISQLGFKVCPFPSAGHQVYPFQSLSIPSHTHAPFAVLMWKISRHVEDLSTEQGSNAFHSLAAVSFHCTE